ncbi:MAG: hypothetical protein LN569_05730 [Rickettsia endosymbiont of Labidopullus appendiculatus]|nr:hypothetical protein [Rickettsia endosymbiont of Labidopullus appendiculatus]
MFCCIKLGNCLSNNNCYDINDHVSVNTTSANICADLPPAYDALESSFLTADPPPPIYSSTIDLNNNHSHLPVLGDL